MRVELTPEEIQAYADEFFALCQQRHAMGAEKYGPVKFMTIDSLQMAIEEVSDLANYALYTYIKLRILQDKIAASAPDPQIIPGRAGFIGASRAIVPDSTEGP